MNAYASALRSGKSLSIIEANNKKSFLRNLKYIKHAAVLEV